MSQITRLALIAAVASLVACVQEVDVHPEDHATHGTVFSGEGEALLEQLTVDEDGFSLTPVFAADDAELVSRVAFRFDAATAFTVQLRSSTDGESFTAWEDAEITYEEEGGYNAHLDVATGTTHAQLRFLAPVEAGLTFLAVEMFLYEPYVEDTAAIDSVVNEAEQGLAADGIVVTRSQWGARVRNCGPAHTPNRLTIHHTVTPNNDSMSMPARMRQIQAFHIDGRGWCDVGYHFLIGQDGKVYQGRPEKIVGAHAASDNTNNDGISFIGTFTSVAPSDAMMNAAARIMKAMSSTYGITLNRTKVKGHRQVGTTATSCPGNSLYSRLDNLISRALNNPGGGGGGNPSTGFCGENGGRTGSWCRGASVVTCNNGSQVSSVSCSGGCQTMPAGTPDRCAAPPAPPATGTGFDDVPSGHWARSHITKAVARGAIAGCDSNSFCPTQPITKAQLAHALATVETDAVDLSGVPAFTDVPAAFRASAREVVARGIMQACGTGFCSNDVVSRAALSVYVRRAQALAAGAPASPSFGDVPASHWAFGAVERMLADGISSGCSTAPRNFCPTDNVTRAQAAVFLTNGWDL